MTSVKSSKFCDHHLLQHEPSRKKYKAYDHNIDVFTPPDDLDAGGCLALFKKVQTALKWRKIFMEKGVCEECRDWGHMQRIELLMNLLDSCDGRLAETTVEEETSNIIPKESEITSPEKSTKAFQTIEVVRKAYQVTKKTIEEWHSLAEAMQKDNVRDLEEREKAGLVLIRAWGGGTLEEVYSIGLLFWEMSYTLKLYLEKPYHIAWHFTSKYPSQTKKALTIEESMRTLNKAMAHFKVSPTECRMAFFCNSGKILTPEELDDAVLTQPKLLIKVARDIIHSERCLLISFFSPRDVITSSDRVINHISFVILFGLEETNYKIYTLVFGKRMYVIAEGQTKTGPGGIPKKGDLSMKDLLEGRYRFVEKKKNGKFTHQTKVRIMLDAVAIVLTRLEVAAKLGSKKYEIIQSDLDRVEELWKKINAM